MSTASKGLGPRGVDILFNNPKEKSAPSPAPESSTLEISKLLPNPNQPRQHFEEESLQELAASIRKQGILQPILVRPTQEKETFEIVAGERRWRAAQLAKLKKVPVIIRSLSDEDVMLAALIENLQREDLNPVEEARAIQKLRNSLNLTQEELAARLGKSRPAIANALRLLQLTEDSLQALQTNTISAGHARALLSLGNTDAEHRLREHILEFQSNVREAEEAAQYYKEHNRFLWDAQEEEKRPPKTRNLRRKSPVIKQLQRTLKDALPFKTVISGTEENGRISISYASAKEMQQVLQTLGIQIK